jgi:HTH-type transcriptional regulator/antitoxin HigA
LEKEMKEIQTQQEYEETFKEFDRLWDAKKSPENDQKLERLAEILHNYERKIYPIDPPSFLDKILFRIDQSGGFFPWLIKSFWNYIRRNKV